MLKKRALNFAIFVEATFPPVSRANLRMYRLGLALSAKGHNVYVISPNQFLHLQKTVFKNLNAYLYPGFAFFLYRRFLRFFVRVSHIIISVIYLQRLNKRIRFDAIHAWNPIAGLASIIGGKIGRLTMFSDLTDFYSDIARYESIMLMPLFRYIERTILANSNMVFTVSEEMKEAFTNIYPASNKIKIVPDGVDPKMFDRKGDGNLVRLKYKLGKSPVIIFHGDIKLIDGVDVLVRAFPSVLKKMPDAKLLIVGGDGPLFEGLKDTVKDLKIESSVIFTGWVPYSEVPNYIAASDVGVMPLLSTLLSNCYLSFKLFEYWGMEKPVIVSKVKAISRIAPHGISSLHVIPGDVNDLSNTIVKVLLDKKLAKLIGRNGRKNVEEIFDWNYLMNLEANFCEEYIYKNN
ncbi:MAG TPA: glycosyltransferase family 4 protein [Nitrososphaerales archaeon]|jgi:glycosyltransferase involved in cell wall biosynthesis|nr:glycosyltransferase family 4 protein [Nitrososphaerales archaeon]|tara:strand:+ start:17166 stop:18377 length:1212 start_codon:yes stop_codon:yes gene_type:complete